MKLFVEMSEEEYERYKQFTNGDYVEPSGKLEDVYRYLLKSGFKEAKESAKSFIDPTIGDITATLEFKKGNTKIIVKIEKMKREEIEW